MSTQAEKIEAIKHAVNAARKRLVTLKALESVNALTRAQVYELDMTNQCIKDGEKLLGEQASAPKVTNDDSK